MRRLGFSVRKTVRRTLCYIGQGVQGLSRLCPAACFPLLLLFLVVPAGHGQNAGASSDLRVSLENGLANSWAVRAARLADDLTGTTGSLELQNISGATVQNFVFYGEYYDEEGRFCFSLVFSLSHNPINAKPIIPDEIREVYASSVGLFAASQPKEIRLFQVGRDAAGRLNSRVPVRAPVTLFGSITGDASKVELGSDLEHASGPVLDLILAQVEVDAKGFVNGVDILNVASSPAEIWFSDVVRRVLTFYPATNNGVPVPGRTLVMVRAVLSEEGLGNSQVVPRLSDWVKSYVARGTSPGNEVPPVIDIVFQRPPTRFKSMGSTEWVKRPPAPPGQLELLLFGSYWSGECFRSVGDPSMPHKIRFDLETPGLP